MPNANWKVGQLPSSIFCKVSQKWYSLTSAAQHFAQVVHKLVRFWDTTAAGKPSSLTDHDHDYTPLIVSSDRRFTGIAAG